MAKSVRTDTEFTQLLRSGEDENIEIIKMNNREIQPNIFCVTPLEMIPIEFTHSPINSSIKEEPLSPQCTEETATDSRRHTDYLKFEGSEDEINDRKVQRDTKSIVNNGLMDEEEINNQSDDAVNIKTERLTGSADVKKEKLEEEETYVTKYTYKGYIKLEDSAEYKDIALRKDVQNINNERVPGGEEIKHEELVEAVDADDMDDAGAAPDENRKEMHAKKIQDGKLTTGGKDIAEKRRTCTIVPNKEPTNRNVSVLHSSEKVPNDEQLLINTCMYSDSSDTANSKSIVSVKSDNDCTGTNTGGNDTSSKHLKRMFIGNDSDNILDENQHREIHSRKTLECKICKVRFNQEGDLEAHFTIHTKEKPYECEICKVRFCLNSNLKRHLKVHSEEKPYECQICKVRFYQNSNLKRHFRVHSKEKPYVCEICKAGFSRNSHLKIHIRVHSKEKPYECEICKVRFCQNSNLKRHLRVHSKEKPYECEICKVRFSRNSHLKTHLRVHTKEKPYECEICKVKFSQKSHLKTHLKVHTKEQTL